MKERLISTLHKFLITWRKSLQFIRRRFALPGIVVILFLIALLLGFLLRVPAGGSSISVNPAANMLISGVPETAFNRRDTLAVGVDDDFEQINPLFSANDGEMDAVSLIFESLVMLNESGDPSGLLANSWTYDAAEHTLTFSLHPDHTFRDGRAVNVLDVIFTYQCALSASYDGPLQGRLNGLENVAQGDVPGTVVFTFADWLAEPDFRLFTIGILKSDYYACAPDKVFEMGDKMLSPEGSGAFELAAQSPDAVTLQRRSGYGGSVRVIILRKVASEEKLSLLKAGELDIVRNLWDTRMQERAATLSGYDFNPMNSSVENYFLVNPEPQAAQMIQRPSQRLAILLTAAGKPLSDLQRSSLQELTGKPLILYYFQGIDDAVLQANQTKAGEIARILRAAGLTVALKGIDWPDLAARATGNHYDILLLPATSNSRLPRQVSILADPVQPSASAWIVGYLSEVYITSKRLAQLSINPFGHPFAASAGSWTDRIENIRFLNADGTYWEDDIP